MIIQCIKSVLRIELLSVNKQGQGGCTADAVLECVASEILLVQGRATKVTGEVAKGKRDSINLLLG